MSSFALLHGRAQHGPPLPDDTEALAHALFDLALHVLHSQPLTAPHARILAQCEAVVAQLREAVALLQQVVEEEHDV